MNVILRNPGHAGGGCIFSDPAYTGPPDTYVTPCPAVFMNPAHPNGGCIFFNSQPIEEQRRGGSSGDARMRAIMRDDEEIIAIIAGAMQQWGFSGRIH
jgi:hypothetical protein